MTCGDCAFDPDPAILWTFTQRRIVVSAIVRFTPLGTELQIVVNGELLSARMFQSGEEAMRG